MKLIIEGPDLSGKTYAIEKIAKYFNSGFVLKNSYKPKTKEDTDKIYNQYADIIFLIDRWKNDDLIILDRFYPSQAVYSILRGKDDFNSEEIMGIETICGIYGFIYVYIDTPLKVLEERYEMRGDEHIKIAQLKLLKERYDAFYRTTILPKITINTMEKDWLKKFEEDLKRI